MFTAEQLRQMKSAVGEEIQDDETKGEDTTQLKKDWDQLDDMYTNAKANASANVNARAHEYEKQMQMQTQLQMQTHTQKQM